MNLEKNDSTLQMTSKVVHLNKDQSVEFSSTPLHFAGFNGPISRDMWEKVESLRSGYKDTFNWAVYDQIQSRFAEDPPRGGVVFKTNFKLANVHSSCSKCHYAFELDTYGRGCIHNCVYCYAKDQLMTHGYWNRPMPFPVDLSEIRKIMYTVFETDKAHKWRSVLSQRVPVRIGSMSDSFMWMDKKYGITKELLKILAYYRYPHVIFTRSDLIAEDDYLEVLEPELASVQFSISGNNEVITGVLEPGAPSVERRLKALSKLAYNGFWTTVRINPLFPMYPDGYFTDRQSLIARFGSESQIPKFELMSWEFMEQLRDAKVPSVLAGFVRLSRLAVKNMSLSTGLDFKAFFTPEIQRQNGDSRFSDREIAYYYGRLKAEANKNGLRFSVCYIGNGLKDYYQYQNLWTNKSDCCDALGRVSTIKKTSQSIEWSERMKHAPCKESAFKVMETDLQADSLESKAPERPNHKLGKKRIEEINL